MRWTEAAADLLIGAACAGCGRPALTLCRSCGLAIAPGPDLVVLDPEPRALRHTGVVAGGEHRDVLRSTLLAWKEEGRFGLATPLAHLLAASIASVGRPGRPLTVVPIPTTRRNRRIRGADVLDDLCRESARLLRRTGLEVRVCQALGFSRRTVDQSALGAADRARNLDRAFRIRTARSLPGSDIVVADDIVTTGSTVAEAVRALSTAGHPPVGVAVIAFAPRRQLGRD